jgi:hypothetical protein
MDPVHTGARFEKQNKKMAFKKAVEYTPGAVSGYAFRGLFR